MADEGALSSAVTPEDTQFDYGSDTTALRDYLREKRDARTEALKAVPTWDEYAAALGEARQPRSRMSQISEALLAYGKPLERGQSKWQALGNAATTLTKGIEAEDAADRAEKLKRMQLKAQYLKSTSDVTAPYDETIDKIALQLAKPTKPRKAPTLAELAMDPVTGLKNIHPYFPGVKIDPGNVVIAGSGQIVPMETFISQYGSLNGQPAPMAAKTQTPDNKGLAPAAGGSLTPPPPPPPPPPPAPAKAPPATSTAGATQPAPSEVKHFTSVDQLPTLQPGKYGMINNQLYQNKAGVITKVDVAPIVAFPPQVQEAIDKGLTGEDFLATLDGPTASQVRAILEGRAPVPTGARSNPRSQMLAQLAAQADPRLDAADYNVRFKLRQSFTSGPDAANITSINTVIKHFGALDSQIDKLQNTSFGWLNKPLQETRMALADKGQQEAVAAFKTTKKLAAGELGKAIQGGHVTVDELKEINSLFDSAKTPTELHAAVASAMELLSSRLEEVGQKYNSGMALNAHPTSFLSKSNLRLFNRLRGLPENTPEKIEEIEGVTPSEKQPTASRKPKSPVAQVKKVLNGVTYIQGQDGWYAQ